MISLLTIKLNLYLSKDTDIVVKAQQSPNNFFIVLHDDVEFGSNTLVNQFWKVISAICLTLSNNIISILVVDLSH